MRVKNRRSAEDTSPRIGHKKILPKKKNERQIPLLKAPYKAVYKSCHPRGLLSGIFHAAVVSIYLRKRQTLKIPDNDFRE